ncbi:MAG TPA: amidohydrolase family protein, partial [Acidobacteriota bacterium]|nr:amidohydrolase family protein [Acidobacteriota bacterium]
MPWDVLIKDAIIVDGSGEAPFRGAVAINKERIAAVGDLRDPAALVTVDAGGKYLAPGFIDIHTHADLIHPLEHTDQFRLLEGKVRQGITTEIVGNCGLGVFPLTHESEPLIRGILAWMTPRDFPWNWKLAGDYLDQLERHGVLLNVGALQAHGPLRLGAIGLVPGPAGSAAIARMKSELERSLDQGAFGLSTGLIYPPGMYTPTEELQSLARVVSEKQAVVTNHIRGSSETLLDAVREILSIGAASGARVHHSHNEAVGRKHWTKIETVLEMEEQASQKGIRVSYDMFPYFGAATMMLAIYPPWSLEGGVPSLLRRLADPETRTRIRRDIENVTPQWPPWKENGWPHNLVRATGWDQIYIGSIADPSLSK